MIKIITVYGGLLLVALGRTLLLALLGLFFACIIGMIFGIMGVVKNRACNIISQVFVDVIRGVPMIVLAFFVYFGIPYFFNTIIGGFSINLSALQAGTICLALNCGAYMAEIVRAGIQSVDVGQMEAARSLGLTYGMAMRKVVLPQAIRTMIPTFINQFIITLKDTSILSDCLEQSLVTGPAQAAHLSRRSHIHSGHRIGLVEPGKGELGTLHAHVAEVKGIGKGERRMLPQHATRGKADQVHPPHFGHKREAPGCPEIAFDDFQVQVRRQELDVEGARDAEFGGDGGRSLPDTGQD